MVRNLSGKFLNRGVIVLLILQIMTIPSSCSKEDKSDLVRSLETIFYDRGFADVPQDQFPALDYGALGDGTTLNTKAIQNAIDAAADAGGGVITFEPGTYLSGALFVKSNVELHIGEGTTIKATNDEDAYPDVWTRVAGIEMNWPAALINIYEQKNVRITGKGTIDGSGKFWWDKFWGDPPRSGGMWTEYNAKGIRWAVDYDCKRVRALVVYGSQDVLLKDFTVKRSGFWTVTMTYCNRVHVSGIVIRNNIGGFGPSSDGINTDSSRDILVEFCDIDCNDDNLCIKAGRDSDGLRVNRPAENIVYRHSITRAGHGLITLGSETSGGMRNIEVYGLKAEGTNTGVRFKSARVRGGLMENIWFHDIEMDQVSSPFHFELDWYPSYSYPTIPSNFSKDSLPPHWVIMTTRVDPPEKGIPEFRDLRISRVNVKNAGKAFHVNAYPEKPMANVFWEDVHIEAEEAGFINHARDWNMLRVTLELPGNDQVKLINCQGVQLPELTGISDEFQSEDSPIELSQLLDTLGPGELNPRMLTLNGENELIQKGDTLFSDTISIILIPGENAEFSFFEPLGDGFYYTPVKIVFESEDGLLSVHGEQTHHWKFYIKSASEPEEIMGVDQWNYRQRDHWVEAGKAGSDFDIVFH